MFILYVLRLRHFRLRSFTWLEVTVVPSHTSRYIGEISIRTQLPFIICMIVNYGQQLCSLFPIMACHYLNQCCLLVGRTKWTNFHEILIEIQIFSFKKIVVCRKMMAILSRPQCAKRYANYIGKNDFYNCLSSAINTLRPRQNGRHFADDILKCIFLNENYGIPCKISKKFVPKGSINNIPALVQIMAWCRPGDKPLSEPMMVSLTTHICVTLPQWIKLKHQTFCYIKCLLPLTHIWHFFQKSGVYRKFHCNISRVVVAQRFSSRILYGHTQSVALNLIPSQYIVIINA